MTHRYIPLATIVGGFIFGCTVAEYNMQQPAETRYHIDLGGDSDAKEKRPIIQTPDKTSIRKAQISNASTPKPPINTSGIPLQKTTNSTSANTTGAEIKLAADIGPVGHLEPHQVLPRDGMIVDSNAPWLQVNHPILSEQEKQLIPSEQKALKDSRYYKQHYSFRLSQDKSFRKDTIQSKPRKWSFYNPFKQLKEGTWYWSYGLSSESKPEKITWQPQTYSFVITGNERPLEAPTTDEFITAVRNTRAPYVYRDIPHLKDWKIGDGFDNAAAEQHMRSFIDKIVTSGILETADTVLEPFINQATRYHSLNRYEQAEFLKKINTPYLNCCKEVLAVLRANCVLKDPQLTSTALKALRALEHSTRKLYEVFNLTGKERKFINEHRSWMLSFVLDAYTKELSDTEKNQFAEFILQERRYGLFGMQTLLDTSDRAVFSEHPFQMGVFDIFHGALVTLPYKKEAETMLRYTYELWLYRNPTGSRTDGAWANGHGYFGTNSSMLIYMPLIMNRLTDFNYFTASPWYENFAKFTSLRTVNSKHISEFGTDFGPIPQNDPYQDIRTDIADAIARNLPHNYWNRWLLQNTKDPRLFKGEHKFVFDYLYRDLSRQLIKYPALESPVPQHKVSVPVIQAAEFRDTGHTIMQSNIAEPSKSLGLGLRACPYGRIGHGGPTQNAFYLYYGNSPLFARTGYNKGRGDTGHEHTDWKHSRGHATILPNGATQEGRNTGWGWLPRFATGQKISYTLGDASHAWLGNAGTDNDPKVKRFRRH